MKFLRSPSSASWIRTKVRYNAGGRHPRLIRIHLDHITFPDRSVTAVEDQIEAAMDAIPDASESAPTVSWPRSRPGRRRHGRHRRDRPGHDPVPDRGPPGLLGPRRPRRPDSYGIPPTAASGGGTTPCLSRTRRADLCAPGAAAARPPPTPPPPCLPSPAPGFPAPAWTQAALGSLDSEPLAAPFFSLLSDTMQVASGRLGGVSEPTGPILQSHGGCGSTHSQLFRWWAWPLPPRTVRRLEATDQRPLAAGQARNQSPSSATGCRAGR